MADEPAQTTSSPQPMDVDTPVGSSLPNPPSEEGSGPAGAEIRAAMATLSNANPSAGSAMPSAQAGQEADDKEPKPVPDQATAEPAAEPGKQDSSAVKKSAALERHQSSATMDEVKSTSDDDDTKPDPSESSKSKPTLKRLNSDISTASATTEPSAKKKKKSKKRRSPASASARSGKTGYQGAYRSAAAAHRNRQIHVPPLGSPGLLMIPTPAAIAVFPTVEKEDGERTKDVESHIVKGEDGAEYLLPSSVFNQSMIAGGYTYDKRKEKPHRGSSTKRQVGDMFDSDAGGLYLHFPELIPSNIWDHRLGDGRVVVEDIRPPSPKKEGNTLSDIIKSNEAKKMASKDRPGPKGARSSYIFFTNAQRPKMAIEFPGVRFAEQGVIMGERWRALTPEERKPFEDKAAADKERYAREMKEYIAEVKKDMQDEKALKDGADEQTGQSHTSAVKEESKEEDDDKTQNEPKESEESKEEGKPKKEAPKGPRLVDSVILSLCKLLGEKVNRKELAESPSPEKAPSSSLKPDDVPSHGAPESNKADGAPANDSTDPPAPRRVTPDLKVEELPQFTPSTPSTRPKPPPHAPMPFLSMLPISLTTTYPSSHAAKRKTYVKAVKKREDAIADAQEAKDDADDAQEKYVAHTEAWERMLDYQKTQVAKREEERKKKREQARMEAAKKEEEKSRESNGMEDVEATAAGSDVHVGSSSAEKKETGDADSKAPIDNGDSNNSEEMAAAPADAEVSKDNDDGKATTADEEKKPPPRAPSPPPEDPMEYMPPRPEAPGPARVVSIPDIPTPPSPPPAVAEESFGVKHTENEKDGNKLAATTTDIKSNDGNASDVPMRVPKLDHKLVQHLDPECFIPTMSGRYFGLLTNHMSDPQFHGILAPGIEGTSYGGGTGLATSYVGGKGGSAGLVSGPMRSNMWERTASTGSKGGSEKKKKKSSAKKSDSKDEGKLKSPIDKSSKKAATAPTKAVVDSSSSPAPSSSKKKRPASESSPDPSSEKKKKKPKRTLGLLGLATGDRKTSATEVGSGPAGPDFPDGWIVKTYRRAGGETVGKTDRFWFSPGRNIRFRARKHAVAFVEILSEPDVEGDEDRAAEIYRARGLHF